MNNRERNDVIETLELARDESSVRLDRHSTMPFLGTDSFA